MTNNNKLFYTIFSFSFPRFLKESFNIVASSHYLNNNLDYPLNSQHLADRLDMIYNNKIRIIVIENDIT
jgi:hypothetical protein